MVTQSGFWDLVRKPGSPSIGWLARKTVLSVITLAFLFSFTSLARASGHADFPLDPNELLQMEQRADAAQPRDQCFLFAEVLGGLTELAGRQIASGDVQAANMTFSHIESVAAKMDKASAANAKRLKNAEMTLQYVTRRLTDMAHVASAEQRSATQAALQNIDRLHSKVLAVLFSK